MSKIIKEISSLPLISLCTPTFNRRPFIPYLIRCIELQDYPKELIEWIIIDDGTDPIEDLINKYKKNINILQIKYFYYKNKMTLGSKRNLIHTKCSGDIIIYMDDDDYYPPERISHSVFTLLSNPDYLICGSSKMYIYYNIYNKIYEVGPYKDNHATAATFAFKKELLKITNYDEEALFAEEKFFTKNYSIPLIQLDPLKTIIVFSHKHNSLNKEDLLKNPNITKIKETKLDINNLINDNILFDFYVVNINNLLDKYDLGLLKYKTHLINKLTEYEINKNNKIEELNKIEKYKKIEKEYKQNKQNINKIEYNNIIIINNLLNKIKSLEERIKILEK